MDIGRRMFLQNIKIPWRTLQLVIGLVTIVTGFCTFLPLGYVTRYFTKRCVLFADIEVMSANRTFLQVDNTRSVWGDSANCGYCTYMPVIACAHAFIWSWFYILMKSQIKQENRQFSLLLPAFIMNLLVFICVFISGSVLSAGIDVMCRRLVNSVNIFSGKIGKTLTCEDTQELRWDILKEQHSFYRFLLIARVSSWIHSLTLLCQCLVCGYRLYSWFLSNTDYISKLKPCRTALNTSKEKIVQTEIVADIYGSQHRVVVVPADDVQVHGQASTSNNIVT